ncbi:MAG: cell division protein FtsQ/DivIB [Xanthomonadales bacterium]|jgi:cell division protein FtsQ|nr:cell division protein FtsQ/DivIB [Xanthomonadales bacterium]
MEMSKGTKLSLLMLSLTVLLMAAFFSGVIKSKHWEVNNIDVAAKFKRVNSEQIRVAVAAYPERSFFKIDVSQIRENLLEIPWVQSVIVTKKWPNTLLVQLNEHEAAAVWNNNKLLNDKGEIFKVDSIDDLSTLPKIYAKDVDSENTWHKFVRYNEIAKKTGYEITSANISDRGGWLANLSNGVEVNLGSQQIDAKLLRLADTWPQLIQLKPNPLDSIDLRYTNGYVVKWHDVPELQEQIDEIQQLHDDGKLNG